MTEGKPKPSTGFRHFINSSKNSMNGFREAFKETAFRQELAFGVILVPLAWILPFSPIISALLNIAWLFMLTTELLNTAVEAVVDLCSPGYHELAKRSKDLASAAVTCAITVNAVAWLGAVLSLFVTKE